MVEFRHIKKRFASHTAVDDVSLSIAAGEFLTLLGPSGCGKTTLLRIASGFESPDGGSVLLAGVDVTDQPPYRRDVNQVFQGYALFPHLTVAENVAYGLNVRGVGRVDRKRRVDEALELVSLSGLGDRKPSQLSGGQKQRVALARALVLKPKVLLLDEPLSALDAKLRRQVQVELKQLQRQVGITFVFVTHDQEEALTMSDRIAVMSGGKLRQVGSPADVYDRPDTAFVATFIGQTNLLPLTERSRLSNGYRLDTIADTDLISVRPEAVLPATDGMPVVVIGRQFKGAFEHVDLDAGGLKLSAVARPGEWTDGVKFCRFDPTRIRSVRE